MLRFVMSYMYDLLNFKMKKGSKADRSKKFMSSWFVLSNLNLLKLN